MSDSNLSTLTADQLAWKTARIVEPGSFEPARHYYPKVLHAQIHPLAAYFFRLPNEIIAERFCHLNPTVEPRHLLDLLSRATRHFFWAGGDLFYTVDDAGVRRMILLETNSSPSGNKSTPILRDDDELGGYRRLLEHAFVPRMPRSKADGDLAVLFDKNFVEASGYAAALAEISGEPVYLAPLPDGASDPPARFVSGRLEVRDPSGAWRPIRAALRYVTKRPWNRIPVKTRTFLFNPLVACLAGGRNKLMAAKAYQFFTHAAGERGLHVRCPETIIGVALQEVPFWVDHFGGYAVVKNPYANAGIGVFTITSPSDLERFMSHEHTYERFIVQGLVGNKEWTSSQGGRRYYHVGTVPNARKEIFAADLRMMVASGPTGFRPIGLYARRARRPLSGRLAPNVSSWEMLGTNLSVARADGGWDAEVDRLMILDRRDFNRLGIGLDDLIDAYVQTVTATCAIDQFANHLLTSKRTLKRRLFRTLNDDPALAAEILPDRSGSDSV